MNSTFQTAVNAGLLFIVEDGFARATYSASLHRLSLGDLVFVSNKGFALLFDKIIKKAVELNANYIYVKVSNADLVANTFLLLMNFTKVTDLDGYSTYKLYKPFIVVNPPTTAHVDFYAKAVDKFPTCD